MQFFTFHGTDPEVCQWVVKHFEDNPDYVDNLTVKKWVDESKKVLDELKKIS